MFRSARQWLMTAGLILVAASVAAQAAPPAPDAPPARRGPIPARDEWLLAQPLLSLPATSPDPLARGRFEARLDGDWGSDFALVGGLGGRTGALHYLVDGEHRSGALTVRRGFGGGFTLGLRASVLWRGPGIMDGVIDAWHHALGFPDGGRSLLPNNQLRVDGRDEEKRPVHWDGQAGTGLGNLEIEAHQVIAGRADAWRAAVVGRVSAPTATGAF